MKNIIFFIALFSITLTACVSHKPTPATETFSLTSPSITTSSTEIHQPIIRMMPTTIDPAFSNSFFIYRISSAQYLTDPYRRFLTASNIEINDYLFNLLSSSTKISLINSANLMPSQYILQSNINKLYADYQNKSAPQAVINMQFILYSNEDNKPLKQVASITLEEKAPIKPNDANSLIAGYEVDLNKISQQVRELINSR